MSNDIKISPYGFGVEFNSPDNGNTGRKLARSRARTEIKRLRKEANDMEAATLTLNGWTPAMPFDRSLDFWEAQLTDGRTVIVSRANALLITHKFKHLLSGAD